MRPVITLIYSLVILCTLAGCEEPAGDSIVSAIEGEEMADGRPGSASSDLLVDSQWLMANLEEPSPRSPRERAR